jgi:manganese/zinc/iron transport system permease protein
MTTAGSKAGLDSYILGKTAGIIAADVALIGGVAAASVGLVAVLFKEFLVVSFDFDFARVQGWPARRIDLALTGLVAVVVVIGLPAVGVVMMAALLILPGVTARFWTDRLARLVVLAAGVGAGMGVVGTLISAGYEKMPAGPVITLVGTAAFLVSALAAPRRGLLARLLARQRDRWRADYAELLRLLYEEVGSFASKAWSQLRIRRLLAAAVRAGDVVTDSVRGYALTAAGRAKAAEVVRQHRLWQLLVSEYPDLVPLARPLSGEPVEERLPPDVVADLTDKLRATGWERDADARTIASTAEGVR